MPIDFTPSIYEHAAAMIGERPWTVSREPDLLLEAHAAAWQRYHHAPVVMGIDIYNLEAEAYGAAMEDPGGNALPTITGHPCESVQALLELPMFDPESAGRIPGVMRAAERMQAAFPDADVRVPVSGPFSVASLLMGFENLLCAVLTDPEETSAALMHLADAQLAFGRAVREHGLDVAFFESAAAPPLLSPDMFAEVELPALQSIINRMAGIVGHAVPCIIGGNTAPILEHMLGTGTGYVICPIETDQEEFMRIMRAHPEVRVRANTDPAPFVHGPWDAVQAELDRLLNVVAGHPNVCLGSGALPYEARPELVERAVEYVRER